MKNLRAYATVTGCYWVFTLTDGALRMLVLFHLHQIGYSPLQVVSLFVFYELFGVITNFFGGWLGARFGLNSTLFAGLSMQIVACALLAASANQLTVPIILVAQGLSGIAKDLTKMSSKSYIKSVVPEGDARGLMKWVALLTGSKNALKGLGFFLGGVLLNTVGFRTANEGMVFALTLMLAIALGILTKPTGKSDTKVRFRHLISKDPKVNWLSASRLFLFGSRDVWFVFALPIFLSVDLGWSSAQSGGFLAAWVIGYGFVQASAPAIVGGRKSAPTAKSVIGWTSALVLPLACIAGLLWYDFAPLPSLVSGLAIFGAIFAVNSAVHSFLIVHYADGKNVSLNVGFYYMANAAGRLAGTVLSGAVFQWAGMGQSGLIACILVSIGMVVASTLLCLPLRAEEKRWHSETVQP
ncbi:MAG: organoarsenical effux MFS transporter ArsJ [Planctomycetota bacterium]|nr:organoarsenical effux MFS transporter ArsJ [Planctomycetota bacterium]